MVSPLPTNSRLLTTVTVRAAGRAAGENAVGCGCHSQRVDVLVPQQRVEQPLGAGHPRGEADQAVGAGGQRRCPARSGWSRSSTARRRWRAAARPAGSRGTARRGRSAPAAGRRGRRRGTRRTRGASGSSEVRRPHPTDDPERRRHRRAPRRRASAGGRPARRSRLPGARLHAAACGPRRTATPRRTAGRPPRRCRRRPRRPAARSRRRRARRCSRGRPRTAGSLHPPARGRPG